MRVIRDLQAFSNTQHQRFGNLLGKCLVGAVEYVSGIAVLERKIL